MRFARRLFELIARLSAFGLYALWIMLTRSIRTGPSPLPARARVLLESLSGLFVKFGQFVAMRPDLVPAAWVRALEPLLDDVPTFSGDDAVAIVEAELGAPLAELFSSFDRTPVASASFAQVHRATLPGGATVAVKVQRPGLQARVGDDLRVMELLVRAVEVSGLSRRVRLREMLDDFRRWTLEELDLRKEAAFTSAMRESEVVIPTEYIPAVYWSHTDRRVLTVEFLSGVWMSDYKRAVETDDHDRLRRWEESGIDRSDVAKNLFENLLRQAFERGTFHADPHAGNLVILDGACIGYVDFGITGHTDERFRAIETAVLIALGQGNVDGFFRNIIKFFEPLPSNADVVGIRREMMASARDWLNAQFNRRASPTERSTGVLLGGVLAIARHHDLTVSSIALRYFRAVTAIEALILTLDPQFPYRENLRRIMTLIEIRSVRARNTPEATATALLGIVSLLQALPARMVRSFGDLDDTRRAFSSSVNIALGSLAWILRSLAKLSGVAAVLALVDLLTGWFALRAPSIGLLMVGLALASLLLAYVADRLYSFSLPQRD